METWKRETETAPHHDLPKLPLSSCLSSTLLGAIFLRADWGLCSGELAHDVRCTDGGDDGCGPCF